MYTIYSLKMFVCSPETSRELLRRNEVGLDEVIKASKLMANSKQINSGLVNLNPIEEGKEVILERTGPYNVSVFSPPSYNREAQHERVLPLEVFELIEEHLDRV
jgi:hypothetical protein